MSWAATVPKSPEERKAYLKKWREDNKDHVLERRRANALAAKTYRKTHIKERREYSRDWRSKNRDREVQRYYKIRATLEKLVKCVLKPVARCALKPFLSELVERLRVGRCEATGVALDMDLDHMRLRGPFCPHLDRVDNTKGYVIDNVRWVCTIYNLGKQRWTHEDFMQVARAAVLKESADKCM